MLVAWLISTRWPSGPKVAAAGAQPERQLALLVGKARARGITWAKIGAAMGMTRQAVWQRFSGEQ